LNSERIGFVGLGTIGVPMAMKILQAGYALSVFNRSPDKAEPFIALGVSVAQSAMELAQNCDIVFLCVSNTAAVESVVFGQDGIVQGGRPGMLLVDLSTIHPVATQEMAKRLSIGHEIGWVDAPVSGGPDGARAGTLAVMAGGSAGNVERARPVLMSFAGHLTHMGPVGNGMATKICNQMLSFGAGAVAAETLNLAARFGIDPSLILEAVSGGFADSNVLRHYGPHIVNGTYSGSGVTGMKDLDIGLDMAQSTGSPIPITSLVASFFRMVLAQGFSTGGLVTPMRLYAQGPLHPIEAKEP